MKVAILGGHASWHTEQLHRACTHHGIQTFDLAYNTLPVELGFKHNATLDGFDAVIVRHVPAGTLEQTLHYLNVLHSLTDNCVVMNQARTIELSTDKILAGIHLQKCGIPIPRTAATDTVQTAMDMFAELGGDVVLKPLTGSLGRGIAHVDDPDIAWRLFHAIIQTNGIVLLQEYIHTEGFDLRLFIVSGQVVAAMQRTSGIDWRYNIARGGHAGDYSPTERQCKLAIAAANAVGADYAGVDLMHSCDGRDFVIEINAIPGWKALGEVTGINIAQLIVDHLIEQL